MQRQVHMQLLLFCGLILGMAFLLSGCSNSLSRAKAESLIKEKGESLLGPPLMFRVAATQALKDATANDDEVNMRVPVDFTPLPKGKYLQAKFVDILEKSGILELVSVRNQTAKQHEPFAGMVEHKFAIFQYASRPNPDVATVQENNQDTVEIIVARPYLQGITGIIQDDSSARVEIEISYKTTEMYSKLKNCAEQLEKQIGGVKMDFESEGWWRSLWNDLSNIETQAGAVNKKKLSFTKYDDGWRVNKN